jgi:cation:H+ antiporter
MGAVAVAAPRQIRLGEQYILVDLHFLLGSAFLLTLALRDGRLTAGEAAFLLAGYAVYVLYLMKEGRKEKDVAGAAYGSQRAAAPPFPRAQLAILAAASAVIYFAARATVSSLESLAVQLGVAPAIIALTILSLGTTLPELVVSATAARAGKSDVAVGNILGSCVFNALAVAGTAGLVGPVSAPEDMLSLPLPVFGASALLFYLLTLDKRVSRWEGLLFLLLYGLFIMEVGPDYASAGRRREAARMLPQLGCPDSIVGDLFFVYLIAESAAPRRKFDVAANNLLRSSGERPISVESRVLPSTLAAGAFLRASVPHPKAGRAPPQ